MHAVSPDVGTVSDAGRPDEPVAAHVVVDGRRFELLSEPFLGMTGSSIFDSRRLFWRARAREVGGSEVGYVTWLAVSDNAAKTVP